MDVSGISSSYLNSITDATAAQEKSDQVKFEEILTKAKSAEGTEDDAALMEACEAFESYYLNKVFGEMQNSVQKSDLLEASEGRDYYEDMLLDAYTKEMAKGRGTGLKEMLFKQLKQN